jgi:hypothetical protein
MRSNSRLRRLGAAAALAVTLGAAPVAQAAPADPAKIALATQVLEATHARNTMMMIIDQMMPQLMEMISSGDHKIPQKVLDRFQTLVRQDMQASLPQVLKAQAEIYARHFSADDLRALIAFYRTPAGQHMITETPKIMQEVMPIGMQWGQAAGADAMRKAIDELRKEGVKI